MSGRPIPSVQLVKELRGIGPAWLSAAVVILASGVLAGALGPRLGQGFRLLGLAGYVIGAIAMGALSIGHEYGHRTLTSLLAQPIPRPGIVVAKVAVLVPMLISLAVLVWVAVLDAPVAGRTIAFGSLLSESARVSVVALPIWCALFIAPALTMLCRNPLAGIVFSLALPGMFWLAAEIVSIAQYGLKPANPDAATAVRLAVFGWSIPITSAAGAIGSWRMFLRLQAIDRHGVDVSLPRVFAAWLPSARARPSRRRSAHWLVAKKELHLQYLTVAVSVSYTIGWIAMVMVRRLDPDFQVPLTFAATIINLAAIPLLAGSLASAEERQFGTVESESLLPMPAWTAWGIKVCVTMGLAVLLSLGLPTLLQFAWPSPDMVPFSSWRSLRVVGAVLLATALALYVSSLSRTGVRALLVAMPAAFMGLAFVALLAVINVQLFRPYDVAALLGDWPNTYRNALLADVVDEQWVVQGALVVALAALVAGLGMLLLRFALINHRSAERGAKRVWLQARAMAAYLAVGLTLWTAAFSYFRTPVVEMMEEEIRIIRERGRQQAIENLRGWRQHQEGKTK